MHIRWNRRLDGMPKPRGIAQFRNDILNFFKRSKGSRSNLSKDASSGSSFSRLFKGESPEKRFDKRSSDDGSKRSSECYIGHKLEYYHTSLLSQSACSSSMPDNFEVTAENFDLLKLDKEYAMKFLNDLRERPRFDDNLKMSPIDYSVLCQSDCNISDSLQLSCDDVDGENDFLNSPSCQKVVHSCEFETEPEVFETLPLNEVKSVNSRWSSPRQTPSKTNAEPRKFISKTELVKEIQELGVLCESRTKELNMLKIQHRHAILGFQALAVLNKHMVQQYDPFSQPQLVKNYEKAKDELKKAAELLQLYQVQLEELKSIHGNELLKLTTKLEEAYSGEIKELKTNHALQLKEMDSHHKEQVKKLKESFKNESAEREQNHCKLFKELQEGYQKQKIDLEKTHAQKLDEINFNHQEIQNELQNNIKLLHHQYETLQRQLQEMEEAFKRDKNAKIQYISAKKTELEKEVDSLKAVLEIKSSQIQGLHNENIKMKKELEELPIAKEKIKNLENKTEDLKAMMQEKMRSQRELSNENQQLAESCEKESRVNIHLSMVNEELQWRLQQSREATLRSASLSASPVLWSSEYRSSEGNRSDSRMSLPILQSEKFGVLSDSLKHSPSKLETETNIKCHSMSFSWHPVLPTHVETVTSKTSSLAKNSELQIDKNTKSNFSGVSTLSSNKLLKDDDEFLKRRSQSTTNQMLVNHPMSMSWGGESFADYYEELDDSYFKDLSSEDSKSKFLRRMPSKQEIIKQKEIWMKAHSGNRSPTTSNNQNKLDLDQDVDKSLSGIISLQSSYTSDSSCSYVPTQPGSEESSSCSNKSQDNDSKNNSDLMAGHDTDPFGRKYPRNLAGEAMIQDIDPIAPISHQTKSNSKDRFDQVDEISSSSPEESKEKFINPVSMTTPSIDTLSSQGMADSTNLDVSWGDEEMLSENDS